MSKSRWTLLLGVFVLVAVALANVGAAAYKDADIYSIHTLISDGPAVSAPAGDAALVNGWGLSAGPTTPWWSANNGTNTSTLYSGVGSKAALTVACPERPPARSSTGTPRTSS